MKLRIRPLFRARAFEKKLKPCGSEDFGVLASGADHRLATIIVLWRRSRFEKSRSIGITEPKRSQNSKRPLWHFPQPHGYSFSENALIGPSIFTLPENNTFSPNSVKPRVMQPGATMPKVENHECLPACRRTGAAVLRHGKNHPETGFRIKQNFATP